MDLIPVILTVLCLPGIFGPPFEVQQDSLGRWAFTEDGVYDELDV